mgnify:CR=1 FL=1
MIRLVFNICGGVAFLLGIAGVFLPLLPTVPFMLLAAFCFARGNPRLEEWLVEHPNWGPHIVAWRENRAIGIRGKRAATIAIAASAMLGLFVMKVPWAFLPAGVGVIVAGWIWTRPDE